MPEADGKSCIEYFDNCAVSLKDQADGKLPILNKKFFCKDCLPGFFWSSKD